MSIRKLKHDALSVMFALVAFVAASGSIAFQVMATEIWGPVHACCAADSTVGFQGGDGRGDLGSDRDLRPVTQ